MSTTTLDADDVARIQQTDDMILERRMRALRSLSLPPGSRARQFVVDICGRRPADLTPAQRHQVATLSWEHRRRLPSRTAPAINPRDPLSPDQAALQGRCTPTLAQVMAETRSA
jgi:hypothetical protein